MRSRALLRVVALACATTLAATACTGTENQAGEASEGNIAFLNYGGFGGGSNPQANYNPYLDATRLGATEYVFESLIVYDNYNCEPKPWLATEWEWTDPQTLVWTLREGVKWNDGKPFTADDVAFTYGMLKEHAALDTKGISRYVDAVEATDPKTVTMRFSQPGAAAFTLFGEIKVVPKHVWEQQADPVTFVNATDPVGTGPFKVKSFNPQQLVIARNPDYWQADKVRVDEIRFNSGDGGGQIDQLKLSRGEYDTNAMFVPDIEKSYVERDPQNNHYWYPPGGVISAYMNLTKAPFDDVAFRKALTTAINRQEIADKAQLGYVKPASQTALQVPGQADWIPSDIKDQGVIGYDAAAADAALTAAGYAKNAKGKRLDKSGKPISFTFQVPGEWSDWVAAQKIIVANLSALGFDVDAQGPRRRGVRGRPRLRQLRHGARRPQWNLQHVPQLPGAAGQRPVGAGRQEGHQQLRPLAGPAHRPADRHAAHGHRRGRAEAGRRGPDQDHDGPGADDPTVVRRQVVPVPHRAGGRLAERGEPLRRAQRQPAWIHPWAAPDRDPGHPGQQTRGLATPRPDQGDHLVPAGGHRAHRGPGEQDVAVAVEAGDQDATHQRAQPSRVTAASRSPASSPAARAASTSSARVTGVGTRTARAPAAWAAPTSAAMSPTTASSEGARPRAAAASRTIPGAGLRQRHPSSGPCGHQRQTANGPSSSSTRACTASTSAGRSRPRATPDWLLITPSGTPAARNRPSARAAPGITPTRSGSPL